MTSAKKFVFTIAADYEGKGELQELQNDLKAIGKIDSYEKLRTSWQQTNKDFAAAKQKVRELRTAMADGGGKELQAQYAAATKEVKKLSTTLGKQRAKLDASRDALKESGIAANDLAGEYAKLKTSTAGQGTLLAAQMKLGIKSTKQVQSEIDGLRQAYKNLQASGTLSMKELALAKDQLRTKVGELRESTRGWSGSLGKIQKGWAGLLATAGAVAGAARGISFFAGFDDSMRDVQAFTEASADDMERLTDLAKDLGASTRFSAAEVGQGMAELAQSGMGVEEMFTSLGPVTHLAAAANMAFKDSADLATNTLKQFDLPTEEISRVTDVIVKGYTSAGHSAEELGQALSYVGPVAKTMGYSLEDTVAILNALAEAGFKGSRGGTALVGGFTRLIKPAKEASAVLDEYKIQIYDTGGKIRSFADIIEDLGAASLSQKDLFTLFGQEAGPGMASLLTQGSDAIRDYTVELEKAGGAAKEVAEGKESGIGGALRSLSSSMQSIVIAFANSVAPAIKGAAELLTELSRAIAKLPQPILWAVTAAGTMVTALSAWHLGLKHIFAAVKLGIIDLGALATGLKGVGASALSSVAGVTSLSAALGVVGVAAASLTAVGFAVKGYSDMRDAQKEAAASADRAAESEARLAEKLKLISQQTGVAINSYQDLHQAVDEGSIHLDKLTGTWKAGVAEIATSAQQSADAQVAAQVGATEEMKAAYQAYANEIKTLQDQIAGREQSLAEKLRSMSRSGMDGASAWEDQKKEAEEYEAAARKAAEAGDFEKAVAMADKAAKAYESLNKEVKSGDSVIVSQQQGMETAMEGVQRAGTLAIEILGKQKQAAQDAATALDEESGFTLSDEFGQAGVAIDEVDKKAATFKKTIEGVGQEWGTVWSDNEKQGNAVLDDLQHKINDMDGQTINVVAQVTQAKALGGMIQHLAAGGVAGWKDITAGARLPGWGGGDKVQLMGEAGEVMINKLASKTAGYRATLAYNAQRWDIVVSELLQRFGSGILHLQNGGPVMPNFTLPQMPSIQHLAAGGVAVPAAVGAAAPTGETVNINFAFASGSSVGPFQGTRAQVRALDRERQRMEMGSS